MSRANSWARLREPDAGSVPETGESFSHGGREVGTAMALHGGVRGLSEHRALVIA